MNIYYFTFGVGHKIADDHILEGKCQPIKAKDKQNASAKMREMYGTQWCWCYTQEEWDKYPRYMKEVELDLITVEI